MTGGCNIKTTQQTSLLQTKLVHMFGGIFKEIMVKPIDIIITGFIFKEIILLAQFVKHGLRSLDKQSIKHLSLIGVCIS